MASANNGASAQGYASRAVGRQSDSAEATAYVASAPRPRASRDELCACHAQLLVYAYISITIYIYIHTPAVAHDMHKAPPVTLWVEQHL